MDNSLVITIVKPTTTAAEGRFLEMLEVATSAAGSGELKCSGCAGVATGFTVVETDVALFLQPLCAGCGRVH